jgi:hypothetical protein
MVGPNSRGRVHKPLNERILSRTKIGQGKSCDIWTGNKDSKGYGKIRVGSRRDGSRKTVRVHRLVWILSFGEIADGIEVLHQCDNPSCVKLEHLFVGTQKDNVVDMYNKGRGRDSSGENNPRAKLLAGDALRIVTEVSEKGLFCVKNLADEFGISTSQVYRIARRECWK